MSVKFGEGKLIRHMGVPYKLCMWSGTLLRKYYAVPNAKGERKGCFRDPMCAVAWIKAQVENEKLHWDKGRNRLASITKDLELSDTEPLWEAPLVSPTAPDFSYLTHPDCLHMARFPAITVTDVPQQPKGQGEASKKRKTTGGGTGGNGKQYKTDKKLYCYELGGPDTTEVTTVDYRDFQARPLTGQTIALQTYKSKDVILVYGGDHNSNRRAEAMFPGTHLTGTVFVLSRKPLHDDGVGSGNTVISEKHATQKKPRKKNKEATLSNTLLSSETVTLF